MPVEQAVLFNRLVDELVLDLRQDGKHLVDEIVEQALRIDWSVKLPTAQDSDDRAE